MRINQLLARATGKSRRYIDRAIIENRVSINDQPAKLGQIVSSDDKIIFDSQPIVEPKASITLILDKPAGYVCSRNGQGSPTIYNLIPKKYHHLKSIGRLDKDSTGLILLTSDGYLAHSLTHPAFNKSKIYIINLDKRLSETDRRKIMNGSVVLDDRPSRFKVEFANKNTLRVTLTEGRNRQIRRTFEALGYKVIALNRIQFGSYSLSELNGQKYMEVAG